VACCEDIALKVIRGRSATIGAVALPLKPPIKPQLARAAKELPAGDGWCFEPKWDGFRTIVFRDGEDVYLQSRNGKPMNRYFPEIEPQVRSLGPERIVLDGELILVVDGIQEFDLLGQRIHPAKSRVEMLAEKTPAAFVAFDLLAEGDEMLMDLPYTERRERLAAAVAGSEVQLTPATDDPEAAAVWLTGQSEGVIAKDASARYLPGERTGMLKIKRIRTADVVVQAFRFGKEPGTVGSLILGLYDDDGRLRVVGHTSGFKAKEKRELLGLLEPYRTHERGAGEASRWKSDEELVWEGLRPELVCEIGFDHITGNRIRHGAKFRRWRDDKAPGECHIDQLRA
jgi:ATP-dependent DNA ligase